MKGSDLRPLIKAVQELGSKKKDKVEIRLDPEQEKRLCSVEIKVAKMWELLVKKTKTGNDTLTNHGRSFSEMMVGQQYTP